MFKLVHSETNKDITNYVTHIVWSGDDQQAARKLEFDIAYNPNYKDTAFEILDDMDIGTSVTLYDLEGNILFVGRIFFKKRDTDSYVYNFTAYDNFIYLAKSKVQLVFNGITVTDGIKQVCNEINIPVGELIEIPTKVSFIADGKSCTEVFKMLLDRAYADTRKTYYLFCVEDKVTMAEKGKVLENYKASDVINVLSSSHSESIEEMVNRVKAVDSTGKVCQVFEVTDDVNKYGLIQDIYKMQPPKEKETVDNIKKAKGLIKAVKNESSIKLLGDYKVITGTTIEIQEEQLKGKFYVKTDTHRVENNIHTMDLTVEYVDETMPEIVVNDIATPVFKTAKKAGDKDGQ